MDAATAPYIRRARIRRRSERRDRLRRRRAPGAAGSAGQRPGRDPPLPQRSAGRARRDARRESLLDDHGARRLVGELRRARRGRAGRARDAARADESDDAGRSTARARAAREQHAAAATVAAVLLRQPAQLPRRWHRQPIGARDRLLLEVRRRRLRSAADRPARQERSGRYGARAEHPAGDHRAHAERRPLARADRRRRNGLHLRGSRAISRRRGAGRLPGARDAHRAAHAPQRAQAATSADSGHRLKAAIAFVLAILAASARGHRDAPSLRTGELGGANVLLVTIDTLRRDSRAASAWYKLGLLELERSHADAAAEALRHAVDADASCGDAWHALGAALVERDRPAAIDAWGHAERLRPRDFDLLFNLGMILADSLRPSEAVPFLERFVREAPRDRYARDIPRVQATLARIAR